VFDAEEILRASAVVARAELTAAGKRVAYVRPIAALRDAYFAALNGGAHEDLMHFATLDGI
jgi:hypothetical protein